MQIVKASLNVIRSLSLILGLLLFSVTTFAAVKNEPLPAEQAFNFSVSSDQNNEVSANWNIAPGYYLYKERTHIVLTPKTPAAIHYPQGQLKQEVRGKIETYSGKLHIPIQLQSSHQKLQLTIDYQGCSSEGFCYPPIHKNIILDLKNSTNGIKPGISANEGSQNSWLALLTDQTSVRNLLGAQHLGSLLLIFLALGLLLAFTPCVLPMVPILTSIIVGQKHAANSARAFFLSLSYVIGSAITYALAGMFAALMGNSLQVWLQVPAIIIAVCVLFVLLALSLFGLYELQLPHHWQNRITSASNKQQGGKYFSVFLMGMISALIVSPCVTAPLIGVLMYIAQTGNMVLGASALFMLGIGMGIPLLLIGVSAGKWLPKQGAWMHIVKKLFGIMMLAMAIWLLARIVNAAIITMLWGVLLAGIAFYLAFSVPKQIGWKKLNRGLGMAVGVWGVLLMVGVNVPTLMDQSPKSNLHLQTNPSNFISIRTLADFNQQVAIAKATHKPLLLDFYADWCESCVTMDKKVFNLASVQTLLHNFILLRADLSKNDADDQRLLKTFNVIAPPTVLFFTQTGQEVDSHRIVGEVNAQEFLMRINTFFAANCDKKLQC